MLPSPYRLSGNATLVSIKMEHEEKGGKAGAADSSGLWMQIDTFTFGDTSISTHRLSRSLHAFPPSTLVIDPSDNLMAFRAVKSASPHSLPPLRVIFTMISSRHIHVTSGSLVLGSLLWGCLNGVKKDVNISTKCLLSGKYYNTLSWASYEAWYRSSCEAKLATLITLII